jgi:serine/threonine protein phosphatase PrpC
VTRFALQVAQRSRIGSRARNEDCLAIEQQGPFCCLVLSDGAGGHGAGERAARLVVERVLGGFRSRPPVDGRMWRSCCSMRMTRSFAGQRESATATVASAMHATVVVLVIDTQTRPRSHFDPGGGLRSDDDPFAVAVREDIHIQTTSPLTRWPFVVLFSTWLPCATAASPSTFTFKGPNSIDSTLTLPLLTQAK